MALNILQQAARAVLEQYPLNHGSVVVEVDLGKDVSVLCLYGTPLIIFRAKEQKATIVATVQTFTSRTFVNAFLAEVGFPLEDRLELSRKGRKWLFRGDLVPDSIEVPTCQNGRRSA